MKNSSSVRLLILCLLNLCAYSLATAAELARSASVFEDADQASKQVLTLKKGSHLEVTGTPEPHNDALWSPVNVSGIRGWVETNTLHLSAGDVGYREATANTNTTENNAAPVSGVVYVDPTAENRLAHTRFWFGVGPTFEATNGYSIYNSNFSGSSYGGVTFAAGMDWLLGSERRMIIQLKFAFPWLNEVSQGNGAGRISRFEVLPGFGYQIIPQTLEIVGHPGLTYIWGEDTNFDSKVAFTPGVSLSLTLSSSTRNSVYQGLEFGIYRVEETRGSADGGLGEGLCDAFSTNDPTCTSGVSPAAFQFILLYKIGGQH